MNSVKGTKDVLPNNSYIIKYVESVVDEVAKSFYLKEIRTPILEYSSLFKRAIGSDTDVVSKEMFEFDDRAGRTLCLRPEGTAGVVRALIESGLYRNKINRLFYKGAMFRAEKPQKGRLREFHQIGVEIVGDESVYADIDVIMFNIMLLDKLGIRDYELRINSVGCPECRKSYLLKLKEYLSPHLVHMCDTCNKRFETNVLRVLDCKEEKCRKIISSVPTIIDSLCNNCKTNFNNVISLLEINKVNYKIDPMIVRGLDYYNNTVFEIHHSSLGAQSAIAGGGRYDGLFSQFDPKINKFAVGSAIGFERLLILLEELELTKNIKDYSLDYYLVIQEGVNPEKPFEIMKNIRKAGMSIITSGPDRISKQLKDADKLGARFVLIFGEDESKNNTITLKDMSNGRQFTYLIDEFLSYIMRI
ncbi:MAG TPA: histidine--tRNA ligase [Spirochaetota bacterium]|nr:histidine--tRNA ligase [Spirochaetota bacterium]HOM38782.1 histidine--tRNA ligase [Spirochaetota bacterium]HPQ49580.1 histidine--tRNA ligase [Spirochaetota bacterium]